MRKSPPQVMKNANAFNVVLVTAPNLTTARKLAARLLAARLVACVNLVPRIESHYWWQGKVERSNEVLLVMKTARPRLAALEKLVLANHPYQTPEVLVLPIKSGTRAYLAWIAQSVRGKQAPA